MKPVFKTITCVAVIVSVLMSNSILALAYDDNAPLIQKLKEAKHTLLEGISQAEVSQGTAISAKFELEDGKLLLSVYTAKEGLKKDSESNPLIESNGEATNNQWTPGVEVFTDREHVGRASKHLTLMQLSKYTLKEIIAEASEYHDGTVFRVDPNIREGKPVADVLISTPKGDTTLVSVPLN